MSQQNQYKKNWVKKDPNALGKVTWCFRECGGWIYFDPTVDKASSGKMIPYDVFTGEKHDCPRSERSQNYNANHQPVEQPEDIPGNVIDAYNQRKKEHKEKLAGTVKEMPLEATMNGQAAVAAPAGGMYTERQHNEIIAMHGLTQKLLGEIRDYLEIMANAVKPGPSMIMTPDIPPGATYEPNGMLGNLKEEYDKKQASMAEQVAADMHKTTEEFAGEQKELSPSQAQPNEEESKEYKEYIKEMEERNMA